MIATGFLILLVVLQSIIVIEILLSIESMSKNGEKLELILEEVRLASPVQNDGDVCQSCNKPIYRHNRLFDTPWRHKDTRKMSCENGKGSHAYPRRYSALTRR